MRLIVLSFFVILRQILINTFMKKIILVLLLTMASIAYVNAQHRAIGGRVGYGLEVSYQKEMGSSNMLSADAGFPGFSGLQVVATYDWIMPIKSWENEGSWNWYAGVGGGAGVWFAGAVNVGIAGRIGVEYLFEDIPLQISFDYCPVIGPSIYFDSTPLGFNSMGMTSAGLAIRYKF